MSGPSHHIKWWYLPEVPPYQMVVSPRDTTLLGSEHLNNLTHNEGKAVYLKNIEKELVYPRYTNFLGSEHI